jgi:N-methylhydantoinase A
MDRGKDSQLSIAVEVGGTFTDMMVMSDKAGIVTKGKVLSTPKNPEKGVLDAVKLSEIDVERLATFVHGFTIATNAVLERKGARTCLLTTKGFKDVIFIQRQSRKKLYDLSYRHPQPLVDKDMVLEVSERVRADGTIELPLDEKELIRGLEAFISSKKPSSLAVCLLHSYKNPDHEILIKRMIAERFPDLYVTCSSEILPEFREYERASTCIISAYEKPIVERYLRRLENSLEEEGFQGNFFIFQSNGGIIPAEAAREQAVRTILSGPAAGVIGATKVALTAGIQDIITLDMGGTSTDVSLVSQGQPRISTDNEIAGLPLKVSMLDIVTVGAGGGSIAWIDKGNMLQVGPISAGADPGPACYGGGGESFTVTDAHVLRGLIRSDKFFGGKMELDICAAETSLGKLAAPLKLDRDKLVSGVIKISNSNMARAIRLVSTEKGFDPREYTIVAFGGCGPLHGAVLTQELHAKRVLIPPDAGLLSAYGLLVADIKRDYVITSISLVHELNKETILGFVNKLQDQAYQDFRSYEIPRESVISEFSMDMRYVGQAHELNIPGNQFVLKGKNVSELANAFHMAHKQRYGQFSPDGEVQIINYRMTAVSITHDDSRGARNNRLQVSPKKEVDVETATINVDGKLRRCKFYQRTSFPPGYRFPGPAVIEEATATSFVPDGWICTVDDHLNLIIERE